MQELQPTQVNPEVQHQPYDHHATKWHILRQHFFLCVLGTMRNLFRPRFLNILKQRTKYFFRKPLDLPIQTIEGFELYSPWSLIIYWDLFIERSLHHRLWINYLRRMTGAPIMIDIGCNEGIFTQLFYSLNPNCRVWGFEPQWSQDRIPSMKLGKAQLLRQHGSDFVAHPFAISSYNGEKKIYTQKDGDGASFCASVFTNHDESMTAVQTRTLDSIFANLPDPDFIKIDVDGHELDVVQGGLETFRRTPMFIMEIVYSDTKAQIDQIFSGWRCYKLGFTDYLYVNPKRFRK